MYLDDADVLAIVNLFLSSASSQIDSDQDGRGDACDPCPFDPADDIDGDGVCGDVDNCPTVYNPAVPTYGTFTKLDSDPDDGSVADQISENLILTRAATQGIFNLGTDQTEWAVGPCGAPTTPFESDFNTFLILYFRFANGVFGVENNLPGSDTCLHDITTDTYYDIHWESWSCCGAGGFAYSRDGIIAQPDADGDGLGDACDPCPNDPFNDADGDGLCGDVDPCPNDPFNDIDGDGVCGDVDNCPTVYNPPVLGYGTFTKLDSDPDDGSVADHISENLAITRGAAQGVYNAGTDQIEWAAGTCAAPTSVYRPTLVDLRRNGDLPDLLLLPGLDTCLHDITTDTYYDIHWVSWSRGGAGGFAYSRDGIIAQPDADGDGIGDACDPCPNDPLNDADGDGLCGAVDPCPNDPDNDADGDGLCGDVDPCPNDREAPTLVCPADIFIPAGGGTSNQIVFNFNDGQLPAGTSVSGIAAVGDDGTGANGVLHLTDADILSVNGDFAIPDPAQGQVVNQLTARWRSLLGGDTIGILQFDRRGADGYSFNWGTDLATFGVGEEGTGTGLTVTVDTWDNGFDGSGNLPLGEAPALDIRWQGVQIAFDNINPDQGLAKDFLRKNEFVDVELTVTPGGLVKFTYDGRVLIAQLPDWAGISGGSFVFGARTGGATDNQWIDDLSIETASVPPEGTQFVTFHPEVSDNCETGFATQELYFNIGGVAIADLRNSPNYPDAPDLVRLRSSLEINAYPQGQEFDNYGTRLRGLLVPPVSGNYVFYLASDDAGELWLSADENPANIVLIASEPQWSLPRQFVGEAEGGGRGFPPSNISEPITLVAGQEYYFEALMKEGGGGDHLAVAWQLPGGPAPVNGSEPINGAFLAEYRTPQVSVVCDPPSGSAFPVGTTQVNCTATDSSFNSSTCSFNVTVLGAISGRKFYDANANGAEDPGESGIGGWKITVTDSGGVATTTYTDENGDYLFNASIGSYTVAEVPPDDHWVATTPTSAQVELTSEASHAVVLFGNVCPQLPANGLAIGYWSNLKGKLDLSTHDPAWRALLNACNLRNQSGSTYLVPTQTTFNSAFSNFRLWLIGAKSINMANLLSAQLAATTLTVAYQGLDDNTGLVVPACLMTTEGANVVQTLGLPLIAGPLGTPACEGTTCAGGNGYITIGALRSLAKASLLANGNTPMGSADRAYQECLKDLLDHVNNNGNGGDANCPLLLFISPTPASCPFASPY